MTRTDKIIVRVMALLTKAEHPGTPEAEAQAAAAKAAELMVRHGISEAAIRADAGRNPEPVGLDSYDISGTGGHGKARAEALAAIATDFGCEVAVYGNDSSRYTRCLLMVGTQSSLAALRILLPSIELQMETAARAATRAYRKQLRAACSGQDSYERRTHAAAFYRDYLRGYGYGVADKIRAMRSEITREAAGTGIALVLARDAARIRAEFAREFPKLGRTRPERHRHPRAHAQGRAEGRRVDIGRHHISVQLSRNE
jgi:Protein of unknown function (DUF2786)